MNLTTIWLIIFVACIVIEIVTLGLTTIWFAGGALIAAVSAALGAPLWLQAVLFGAVSLALLYFTRPIAVKYFNKDRVKTNAESLVGKQAVVISEIDNLQGVGQVTVNGQEWSARSADDKVRIPTGSVVTVAAISGVKLIVRIQEQFGTQERAEETAESAQREMEQVASGAEGVRQAEANTAGSADELSPEPGTAEDEN